MKTNKIGSIFLISVLALAGIGISYAGWTDTITVSGNVSTGDVDIDLVKYSGTWVYKWIPQHAVLRHEGFSAGTAYESDPSPPTPANEYMLVAHAWAAPTTPGADDDGVTVTYQNLFPCQDFKTDFVLHYDGSIPARLMGPIMIDTNNGAGGELPDNFNGNTLGYDWLEYLWYVEMADGNVQNGGIEVKAYRCDANGVPDLTKPVTVGDQFEECNYIYVQIIIHIPQNNIYMNLNGGFTTNLVFKQWDKFNEP